MSTASSLAAASGDCVVDRRGTVILKTILDVVDLPVRHRDSDSGSLKGRNVPQQLQRATREATDGNTDRESEGDERESSGSRDRTQDLPAGQSCPVTRSVRTST